MYHHGLIVGKMWPVTNGHLHLIDTAAAQCQLLDVIVIGRAHERPSANQRFHWLNDIYKYHPNVEIGMAASPGEEYELDSPYWAKYVEEMVSDYPDAFFTSEPYGETWAAAARDLGYDTVHVQVDLDRSSTPISGTQVRAEPVKYWNYIPTSTKEFYAKRFCVIGGESTGKSTLSRNVAAALGARYTIEAGRDYVEFYGARKDDPAIWSYIMREQPERERLAAMNSNGIVVCDTDLLSTCVWYEMWVGKDDFYNTVLMPTALATRHSYDHFFMLDHNDVPWVDDGTRSEGDVREEFSEKLLRIHRDYHPDEQITLIGGTFQERGIEVTRLIKEMLS